MDFIAVGLGAGALGGALLLIAAGLTHARSPRTLRLALLAQRMLPAAWVGAVAAVVALIESLIGLLTLVTVLAGLGRPSVTVMLAQAALFGCYAGYLVLLRIRRPGAPCGCFGWDEPATWFSVTRAAVFAGAAAAAAGSGSAVAGAPLDWKLVMLAGAFVAAASALAAPLVLPGRLVPSRR